MARGGWVYIGGRAGNKPRAGEKSVITAACEKFIAEVLMPRFLPKIRPTKFNYPIAIYGKWHGNKYRNSLWNLSPPPPMVANPSPRPPKAGSNDRQFRIASPAGGLFPARPPI